MADVGFGVSLRGTNYHFANGDLFPRIRVIEVVPAVRRAAQIKMSALGYYSVRFVPLSANFQVNTYNLFNSIHCRLRYSSIPWIRIWRPCFQHPRCAPGIELHLAARDTPKILLRIDPTIDLDID
jgi:hypothetical protein